MSKPGYPTRKNRVLFYSLFVVIGWGLVPTLAKAANFPGGFTTFWVNLFATLGVLGIMTIKGELWQLRMVKHLPRFIALSLVWPLFYSLAYFNVINATSGSLATTLNYLWPLFALLLLSRKMVIPKIGIIMAMVGFCLVAATMIIENDLKVSGLAFLGLSIPFAQAWFNVQGSDESKYPGELAWLLTLVGAVITTIGAGIYILLFEHGQFTLGVSAQQLLPLFFIGVGGNSIGFYAFLRAGQESKTPASKVLFIWTMFLIPFAQVLILVVGVEHSISPVRIFDIAVVAIGFLAFKLWENRQAATI